MASIKYNMDFSNLDGKFDGVAAKTILETVKEIEKTAKQFAPVKTGKLRNSIKGKTNGKAGEVGSDLPYSGFVENGTRKMPAHPFLRPAFESALSDMKKRFIEEMKK